MLKQKQIESEECAYPILSQSDDYKRQGEILATSQTSQDQIPLTPEDKFREILLSNDDSGVLKGCSSYQVIISVFIVMAMTTYGWMQYGLGFYELFPVLLCGESLDLSIECTSEQICANTKNKPILGVDYWIDESSIYSLNDMFQQLNMICDSSQLIGWIGSAYFVGWTAGCLILPVIADKIGRKWIVTLTVLVQFMCHAVMIFTHSIGVTIAMSCVNGVCCVGRNTIAYVYMTEFLTPENATWAAMAFNVVDGSTGLWVALYFRYVDTHWRYVASVGVFTGVISTFFIVILVPESPLWLLKTGQINRAQTILKRIIKQKPSNKKNRTLQLIDDLDKINILNNINRTNMTATTEVQSQELLLQSEQLSIKQSDYEQDKRLSHDQQNTIQKPDKKPSTLYFLKQRRIQVNLIILAYAWSCASFGLYLIGFLIKYLPGDIYDNAYASQVSEVMGYSLGAIISKKLKPKPTFMIGYGLSMIGGILIIFVGDQYDNLVPFFIILVKCGTCMVFVICFIATSQCFPSEFSGAAFGFCNFFSRGISIGAPQMAEVPDPIPMIVLSTMMAIGLISTPFLKIRQDSQ